MCRPRSAARGPGGTVCGSRPDRRRGPSHRHSRGFREFRRLLGPFLGGTGSAPKYCVSLSEDARANLRDVIRSRLPIGPDGEILLAVRVGGQGPEARRSGMSLSASCEKSGWVWPHDALVVVGMLSGGHLRQIRRCRVILRPLPLEQVQSLESRVGFRSRTGSRA